MSKEHNGSLITHHHVSTTLDCFKFVDIVVTNSINSHPTTVDHANFGSQLGSSLLRFTLQEINSHANSIGATLINAMNHNKEGR